MEHPFGSGPGQQWRQRWSDPWFRWAVGLETGLAVVAWGLGALLGISLGEMWSWSATSVGLGLLGTVPLLAGLWCLLRNRSAWGASILRFLHETALPLFARWSRLQLGLVSLLAGLGEELLFRGVIQTGLVRLIGDVPGLVVASALFAGAHLITPAYGLAAGLVGVYLGLLWTTTGNLVVPVVTHAVYDYAALLWLLRWHNRLRIKADH